MRDRTRRRKRRWGSNGGREVKKFPVCYQCMVDVHGCLQGMPSRSLSVLILEYDKECRKHGRRALRIKTELEAK